MTTNAESSDKPRNWAIYFADERDFCLSASPLIGAAYSDGDAAVRRINESPWGRSLFGAVSAEKVKPAPGGSDPTARLAQLLFEVSGLNRPVRAGKRHAVRSLTPAKVTEITEALTAAGHFHALGAGAAPVAFQPGDQVVWTSSAAGSTKTKMGTVAQVVKKGGHPDRKRFAGLFGSQRNHQSYVVVVEGVPYWPRVSLLRARRD